MLPAAALLAGCLPAPELPAAPPSLATSSTTSVPSATASTRPAVTTTPPPPTPGGEIVVGVTQEPPTLNPLAPGGDTDIVRALAALHAPGAYSMTGDLVPVPMLAWLPMADAGDLVPGEDGTLTVRWRINEEAVWSDGVPVSGDDFAFTLALPGVTDEVPEIMAVSTTSKSISITFAEPTLAYETLFPVVVPRHAVEGSDFESEWNTVTWPSSGPFVLDEWVQGSYLRFVRNERFWISEHGFRLPYLDAIEVRFLPQQSSLVEALTDHRIDIALDPGSDGAAAAADAGAAVWAVPGLVWESVIFSFAADAPGIAAEELDLRRAVAMAVDRDRLAAEWHGVDGVEALRMDGLIESQRSVPEGPWSRYGYDPDAARAIVRGLCATAGCPDGPLVTLSVSGNVEKRVRMATAIVAMLQEAGIEAELDVWNVLDLDWWNVAWQAGTWSWQTAPGAPGFVDTLATFDPTLSPGPGGNIASWGSSGSIVTSAESVAEYERILTLLRMTYDREEAERLALDAEAILADQIVLIPLFRRLEISAYWRDAVAAFRAEAVPASQFADAYHWHIP